MIIAINITKIRPPHFLIFFVDTWFDNQHQRTTES